MEAGIIRLDMLWDQWEDEITVFKTKRLAVSTDVACEQPNPHMGQDVSTSKPCLLNSRLPPW